MSWERSHAAAAAATKAARARPRPLRPLCVFVSVSEMASASVACLVLVIALTGSVAGQRSHSNSVLRANYHQYDLLPANSNRHQDIFGASVCFNHRCEHGATCVPVNGSSPDHYAATSIDIRRGYRCVCKCSRLSPLIQLFVAVRTVCELVTKFCDESAHLKVRCVCLSIRCATVRVALRSLRNREHFQGMFCLTATAHKKLALI